MAVSARCKMRGRGSGVWGAGSRVCGKRRMWKTRGLVENTGPGGKHGVCWKTKCRRHTDPKGRYDQNEIKRNKGLNYFKQNCPIFRFAIAGFQCHAIQNRSK